VKLVAVSAAELGFETDTASLADIYVRAQELGFAAAEVAPQLGFNILTSRSVNFSSSEWSQSRRGTASPSFLM
jgi:hypothetical protein